MVTMSDRWLSENEYSRIRYRAKKMGAQDVCLSAIWHHVNFGHTSVSFVFKPLQYHVNIRDGHYFHGHFSDKEGADAIKRDMDLALEFIEFLKEFSKTIE